MIPISSMPKHNFKKQLSEPTCDECYDILMHAPIGIFTSTPGGRFLFVNLAFAQMYGYDSPEELIRSITDIEAQIYASSQDRIEFQRRLESSGEIVNYEYQVVRVDGSWLWVSTNARVVRDRSGAVIQYQGYTTDITERKQAEKALRQSEEQYKRLVENISDVVWIMDLNLNTTYVSPAVERVLGESVETHKAKSWPNKLPPDSLHKASAILAEELDKEVDPASDKNRSRVIEIEHYHADGGTVWLSMHVSFLRDDEGEIVGIQGVTRDITERRRMEERLQHSEKYYRTIFETSGTGTIIIEQDTTISLANSKFEELTGYSRQEIEHRKSWTEFVHPDDLSWMKNYHDLRRQGASYAARQYEFRLLDRHGQRHDIYLCVDMIPGTNQSVASLLDITERKRTEEQLKYLSFHDQLTGLNNRAYLENELIRLNKSREYPISIISIDLDGLKFVNDTLGHKQGDAQLRACARVLQDAFRASDIIARIGGDEFVALLPRTDLDTGEQAVNRIRSRIERSNVEENRQVPLTLSIGLACAEDSRKDLSQVLKQADDLMYRDKLNRDVNSRSQIMKALMAALEERDFITSGHAHRLEDLCVQLGEKVNLTYKQLSDLVLLTQMHDLGKVGIPDHILFKPGPLSDEEWEIMRQHSEKGHRIAQATNDLAGIADLILKHHERWDGQGYPLGLKGEEIPIECRILAIADSFDAMINDRPYRKALTVDEALEELTKCAGTQFDPHLVQMFLQIMAA